MIKQHGINLFYKSVELRELCCETRKVRPLIRALNGLSAWITGLRRSHAESRREIERFEIDAAHDNILKINPLASWSEEQVWNYISAHRLPYNALHDRGYRSIGCACCTRPTNPGEDIRAGRWWWEENTKKECGIHIVSMDQVQTGTSNDGATPVRPEAARHAGG
jgi:phosphoadenylyl-sulfate reductase (thioredoxin)